MIHSAGWHLWQTKRVCVCADRHTEMHHPRGCMFRACQDLEFPHLCIDFPWQLERNRYGEERAQIHLICPSRFLLFFVLSPLFILVAPANLFQGELQGCLTVAIDHCLRADLDDCKTGYDTLSLPERGGRLPGWACLQEQKNKALFWPHHWAVNDKTPHRGIFATLNREL